MSQQSEKGAISEIKQNQKEEREQTKQNQPEESLKIKQTQNEESYDSSLKYKRCISTYFNLLLLKEHKVEELKKEDYLREFLFRTGECDAALTSLQPQKSQIAAFLKSQEKAQKSYGVQLGRDGRVDAPSSKEIADAKKNLEKEWKNKKDKQEILEMIQDSRILMNLFQYRSLCETSSRIVDHAYTHYYYWTHKELERSLKGRLFPLWDYYMSVKWHYTFGYLGVIWGFTRVAGDYKIPEQIKAPFLLKDPKKMPSILAGKKISPLMVGASFMYIGVFYYVLPKFGIWFKQAARFLCTKSI